jgi:TolB protein
MNADGSRVRRLTKDPARDREPAWSPDSSKIVFTSTRADGFSPDLYVMNADGSAETAITATSPTVEKHPAWSPDGGRIAFFRGECPFNCTSHIYTAAPDGSDVTQLTSGDFVHDRTPDWSPDGTRVVFNRELFQNEFWIVNRDGSGLASITGTHLEPAWSPDGTRMAHGYPGVGHMNLDGSDPRLVFANGSQPDWQPLVGPRPADFTARSEFCRAEREFLGIPRFRAVYGTFGGCMSGA